MKLVQGTTEEVALEVFDHFDLNRSGQISLAEFTAALGEAYLEQADHYQTIRALVAPVQVIMEEEQYEML
jgi:Ca2+-binding EF-hand superfamily protein